MKKFSRNRIFLGFFVAYLLVICFDGWAQSRSQNPIKRQGPKVE